MSKLSCAEYDGCGDEESAMMSTASEGTLAGYGCERLGMDVALPQIWNADG